MAMGRVKVNTDVWIDSPEFEDANERRPEWAWDASSSEYLAHLISVGWSPKTHEWSESAKERSGVVSS